MMIHDHPLNREHLLFAAIKKGDTHGFRCFLENGYPVDLFEPDNIGDTPLLTACRLGKVDIVKIALDYGAKNDPHPSFGSTALQIAVSAGHVECVKLILEEASKSNADAIIVNHEDSNNEAPIHVASRCGNIEILRLIVNSGANLTLVDARGQTCLHCASNYGHDVCLKYLLQEGGGIIVEEQDIRGQTCLHCAVLRACIKCCSILLDFGSDINAVTFNGDDVFQLAKRNQCQKIISLLKRYKNESLQYEQFSSISATNESDEALFQGMDVFNISSNMSHRERPLANHQNWTKSCASENLHYYTGDIRHNLNHENDTGGFFHRNSNMESYDPWEKSFHQNSSSTTYDGDPFNERSFRADQNNNDTFQNSRLWQQFRHSTGEHNLVSNAPANVDESKPKTSQYNESYLININNTTEAPTQIEKGSRKPLSDHNFLLQRKNAKSCHEKKSHHDEEREGIQKSNQDEGAVDRECGNRQRDSSPASKILMHYNRNEAKTSVDKLSVIEDTDGNTESEPLLKLKDDLQVSKYFKMAQVGVPVQSVICKMKLDNIPASKVEAFKQVSTETKLDPKLPSAFIPGGSMEKKTTTIPEDELRNDPKLLKYFRMQKVKVPIQSIIGKMHLDKIPAIRIEAFKQLHTTYDEHEQKAYDSLPLPPPPQTSQVKRQRERDKHVIQRIHWKAVKEDKIDNSLWASTMDSCNMDDIEIKELESIFAAKPPSRSNHMKIQKYSNKEPKTTIINLIDVKRANNISISLAQFRAFKSYDDLCVAVVSLDTSNLSCENLQNMQTILPTTEELVKITRYQGTDTSERLGRAEIFFKAVSKHKHFAQKLNSFVFSLQFSEISEEIEHSLTILLDASKEIINSCCFAGILRRLLAIGNLVNGLDDSVKGITIDQIKRVANKKGYNGVTLLDHVVAVSIKQGIGVEFWKEMKHVKDATRLDFEESKKSYRYLQNGIKKMESAIDTEHRDTKNDGNIPSSLLFIEKSKAFLSQATESIARIAQRITEAERNISALYDFFAEEMHSCKVNTIFSVVVDFISLVQKSKEAYKRKVGTTRRLVNYESSTKTCHKPTTSKDVRSVTINNTKISDELAKRRLRLS